MKRVLFLIILSAPFMVQAQFQLTASGFVAQKDSTKTYFVVDVPGTKQAELYKRSLLYLNGLYVSPKDVLSSVDGESITVNAVAKRAIKMKHLYLNPSWDVNYTIGFQFKDDRLRITRPSINKIYTYTGDIYRTASISGNQGTNHKEIYSKKGELKLKDGKENLETYINGYVKAFIEAVAKKTDDNW